MLRRDEFNMKTHNGKITIRNPETDGHRTFKITTVDNKDSDFHGKRIVSMFTGTDNTDPRQYTGFGFVVDGIIKVWAKKNAEDKNWQKFAQMLMFPQDFPSLEYMFAGTCRKCNRELTNPKSITNGIGAECAKGGRD
jgi:hypothetical protein